MLKPQDSWLILLAAGRSLRFGAEDKLSAPLAGKPLALHAVRAAAPLPFARRLAIVSDSRFPFARHGFDIIANDDPARGLSSSLRLGIDRAQQDSTCAAALILLADMPRVSKAHLGRLFAASDDRRSIIFSVDGERTSPPALIGSMHFDALASLTGDQGARALAKSAVLVTAAPGELADVDTPADLARLEEEERRATPIPGA